MSQTANQVTIQLLGKNLTVRCPEDQKATLESAAKDLNTRLQALRLNNKTTDADHLLILLALNLAAELNSLQYAIAVEGGEFNSRIENLQAIIHETLIRV